MIIAAVAILRYVMIDPIQYKPHTYFWISALDQATVPNRDLDMNASAISLPVLIAKVSPIIWKVYFVVWRAHIVIFSAKEVFDLYSLIKRELRS